ncbi:hypothetical protein OTU49_001233 [Cherax quadricarinatus]|uniref:Uncharacterized protein n=1 Tax=Cherax quadricarinatus TaxID=27406 RepID=A0AAW0XW90_CHEQU
MTTGVHLNTEHRLTPASCITRRLVMKCMSMMRDLMTLLLLLLLLLSCLALTLTAPLNDLTGDNLTDVSTKEVVLGDHNRFRRQMLNAGNKRVRGGQNAKRPSTGAIFTKPGGGGARPVIRRG